MSYFAALVRITIAGMLLALAGPGAAQQAYPAKPIRIITAYPPGGGTDMVARLLAQKLTESWGQPALVDSRPGGGGIVATEALAKSPPDGYTIMLAGSSHVLVPLLLKTPYDPIKDFAPVATVDRFEYVLVRNLLVPGDNLKEFIDYAKSRPGQLNYATPGAGGGQHLAHELLNLLAGIKTQHIPYKGAGPALTDLLGGQVQLHFSNASPAIPHIKSGRLKALAITGEKRLPALPEVPTFIEAGLPGLAKMGGFNGVLAPAGTPKPIIDKLSTEIAKYLALPDVQERLISQGLEPFTCTPEQFAALLKDGLATNAKIINSANIKFEN